jgi:TolA-binding protein
MWTILRPRTLVIALAVILGSGDLLHGQEPGGTTHKFTTLRRIQFAATKAPPEVVVAEFYTHGELNPLGSNLAVETSMGKPVPCRVLQVGPGDFCRVAFQPVSRKASYKILYGGNLLPEKSPAWETTTGLMLETRRWKPCNLSDLASVQSAFASSQAIGSDYVAGVFHGSNPFWPDAEPFLSRYRGTLFVKKAGKYQFFTSSQDCSFLLIDGKAVVASPGAHGPAHDARVRGEITLAIGAHDFEYHHAASGPNACMVAAWQAPDAKQPEIIPAEAFQHSRIARIMPGPPQGKKGTLPDFAVEVLGDAPLADIDVPLVRARFRELSTQQGKMHWAFGDGITANEPAPIHVYLHPGLFGVRVGVGSREAVNRVYISRAGALPRAKKDPDHLADYLPLLNRYDATRLDPLSALQLMRFCEQVGQSKRAVLIARSLLLSREPPSDDAVLKGMADIAGPILRDRLDDAATALAIYRAAAKSIQQRTWKTGLALKAADICLHDLHQRSEAKQLLDVASSLPVSDNAALVARRHRLCGDWHARAGDKKAALVAYDKAGKARSKPGSVEAEARRGAYSRSTEAFLRTRTLDRARDELRRWQEEFPGDTVDGYLSLLLARYYVAAGKLRHAVVVAGDLLAINAESPYADQLLFLAAGCEEKLMRLDQAQASYRALLANYPGSPLVSEARQKLSQLSK